MDAEPSPAAIQSQVLRTTLAEITSTRSTATTDTEQPPAPDCCVICLDELSEPGTAQPCGHANFDFICLTNWLAVDPKCPLCKAAVLKVRYTDSTGPQTYSVPQKDDTTTTAVPSPSTRTAQTTFQHYFLNRNLPRRRPRAHPHPPPVPSPSSALLRRRQIYTQNLYSLHIGANPLSRYRSGPTPSDFASDAHLVSRARTFIRRELQVFSFLSDPAPSSTTSSSSAPDTSSSSSSARRANNAEFLLEYTVAILKTVDMQGAAGQAEGMLADFLGRDSARLFLHELRAWLRSPCLSLAAWDREVQYPDPEAGVGRKRGGGEEGEGAEEGRERGRGRGRGSGRGRREGGEERGRGDYWRPGYRRYADKRRRTGDERRVEVGG
ncbi:hypothetical protein CONLIGDRAFT_646694 [Coniochaeta ligniaria NRRL 30616]|uniref:RING-type E3 ubiquitin transferase n=1 Tax=Coniochaeta ligniaria NRRL 30616 TaxID=1408157 RepID=A0A1J7IGY0_9PEZI|nr:hypothetical protein CONLIGDRAFT_646694 [Coniochaeta ligniaria NRRL 30616]